MNLFSLVWQNTIISPELQYSELQYSELQAPEMEIRSKGQVNVKYWSQGHHFPKLKEENT